MDVKGTIPALCDVSGRAIPGVSSWVIFGFHVWISITLKPILHGCPIIGGWREWKDTMRELGTVERHSHQLPLGRSGEFDMVLIGGFTCQHDETVPR